jgi:PAS domain S-box-containing protein
MRTLMNLCVSAINCCGCQPWSLLSGVLMAMRPSYEELKQRLAELESEIRERRRVETNLENELIKFRGLYDLAIAMTSDRSEHAYLQFIVDKCRQLLCSDISYIALRDEKQDDFYKHTSSGIQTEAFRNRRLPSDKGLGGFVARTRQGYIVHDYLAEKSFDRRDDHIVVDEGIVSGMAVPIQMGSKNLGVLYVFNRTRTNFSQSDLNALFLIGNLAAVEISRKQAEDSLRESEERFRFMVETTGDAIYRLRYDSMSYDYLSPGIHNLTGYLPEEIKTFGFSKLVAQIDLPGEVDVTPDVIVTNRREGRIGEYRADYLVVTKSGDSKWLRDHSFPWFNESATLVGSVGILSDVTDYKRAEALVRQRTADLLESEEKYRTLVENVPLVVYRVRPTGEILFINQFVEELMGYSPVEILRDPDLWSKALYDEDRARVTELRQKAQGEGQELIVEYRVMHKNGYLVYVVDHAIPSRTSEGLLSSVDGIIMDVTGRVKLQEKLIQSEGIKTISEVSARLAHEIRNPLVSAGGFARRLLSSMSPNDPNREKMEIIVKEVGRLEVILRMILNYIQPVELELSPTEPNSMVEMALQGVEGDMRERNVSLRTELAPRLPKVSVDRLQMEQVLKTLLRNALSQMPSGAMLSISTSLEKDMLQLVMRYPVLHLSRDDVEHFFYPFTTFKVDYQVVDLPMSKILVHKHAGMIEVKLEKSGEIFIRIVLPT